MVRTGCLDMRSGTKVAVAFGGGTQPGAHRTVRPPGPVVGSVLLVFTISGVLHADTVQTQGQLPITADQVIAGSYVSLGSNPAIEEASAGEWEASSTIVISAPTGFRFNTGAVCTATIVQGDVSLVSTSVTPVNNLTIIFSISAASTGASRISFSGIQLKQDDQSANPGAQVGDRSDITVITSGGTLNGASLVDVTIIAGVAHHLAFSTQPAATAAGGNLLPAVRIQDQANNTVTNDNRNITLAIQTNPGSATLNGTKTLMTTNGVATWTATEAMNITVVATGYTLRASHDGTDFTGTQTVDSSAFNITPAAAHHLAFSTQPANSAAGANLLPVVRIQDQYNNTVTNDNRTITLTIQVNPGGATLFGTTSLVTTGGVATWTATQALNIRVAATGYQLRASHSGAAFVGGTDTVDSAAFNITPGVAHHLAFTTQPVNTTAGLDLLPAVTIQDQYNNTVTNDNRTITLAIQVNPGGGSLSGTTSLLTVNGVATWTATESLDIKTAGTGYTLRASKSGAAFTGSQTVDSNAFNITAETTAHHLAFTLQPANSAAGAALLPRVAIQDQYNNTVTTETRNITLAIQTNPGSATLNGTTTLTTSGGIATWTAGQTLNITVVATGYTLRASHDGAAFSSSDTVDSSAFNITPAAAHHMVFSTQPVTSGAGVSLLPAVTIQDQYNNTVTGDNRTISFTLLNAGGATLSGTTSLLSVNGVATWTGTQAMNIQKVGTGYQLRASHSGAVFAGGSDTVDSAAFDITAGSAHHLAFVVQPADTAAGGSLLPSVEIQDQYNNTVTGDNRTITLAIQTNPGSAALNGTLSLATTNGVATWTAGEGLNITVSATGYTLRASHDGAGFPGSDTVDSSAFNITPQSTPHHLGFIVQPATSAAAVALTPQVAIQDQYNNTITTESRNITLTFAANPGSAALNGTTTLATTNGVAVWTGAQNMNIQVAAVGYQLRASHDGAAFSGSDTADSGSFDITAEATAHHLAFAVQPVTSAAGVSLTPQITVQDQYNNTVTAGGARTITLTLLNAGGATLAGTTAVDTVNGVATWTGTENLRIEKIGTGYQLRATGSGGYTGSSTVDSATFSITASTVHHLVFSVQPATSTAGADLLPQVILQDQFNNIVTGDERTITLAFAANPGGAALNGTVDLTTTGGVATWTAAQSLDIRVAATGYRLRATGSGSFGGSNTADSSAFNITPDVAHHLAFTTQPVTTSAGDPLLPQVTIQDQFNNTVTSDNRDITLTLQTNPGGATLNGTTTLTTVGGVATWIAGNALNITVTAGGYQLRASHSGAGFSGTDTVDSAPFSISSDPLHHFDVAPGVGTALVNNPITLTITARDSYGNAISGHVAGATITVSTNTGGDGTNLDYAGAHPSFSDLGATATFSAGATFDGNGQIALTITNRRAEAITITVSDGVAGNGTTSVTWTAETTLNHYSLQAAPSSLQVNTASTLSLFARDQYGNPIPNYTTTSLITLSTNTGGDGTNLDYVGAIPGFSDLGATATIPSGTSFNASGLVTFNLTNRRAEVITVTAADGVVTDGTANVTWSEASALLLVIDPIATQMAGAPFNVTVRVTDQFGNPANVTQNSAIKLRLGGGTGTLGGTTTGTITAGTNTATLTGVTYDRSETGVVLIVDRTSGDFLVSGSSAPFTVTGAAPVKLSVGLIGNQVAGTPFSVTVTAVDSLNNASVVTQNTDVQLSVFAGTGALSGTLTGTIAGGTGSVTLTAVQYGKAEGNVVLRAARTSGDVLASGDSSPFTVSAGAPTRLGIEIIGTQVANVAFAVTVDVLDADGNRSGVSVATPVQLSLDSGTGALGGTLTRTLNPGDSSITFSVTYDTAQSGVSLLAQRTGGDVLAQATSNAFTVLASLPVRLDIGPISDQTAGAPFNVTVNSVDGAGNLAVVVADTTVLLSRNTGTGTLGGTLNGLIAAGTNSVVISGVTYDKAEAGVSFLATRTGGDALAAGSSNAFSVSAATGGALRFVLQPTNTDVSTPLNVSVEIIDAYGNRTAGANAVSLTLVDPGGCGNVLTGNTTVHAVSGLASFGTAQDVKVGHLCTGYRLRASAAGLGTVESNPFNVTSGTNLTGGVITLGSEGDTTPLSVTYTVTGSQTVNEFRIAYGLKRDAGNGSPIDTTFGFATVTDPALRTVGVHTVFLADVRPFLNQNIRHGDRIVVQLDVDNTVAESSEDDNTAVMPLSVDVAVVSVMGSFRPDGSCAHITYWVESPADVPSFVIRLGLDTNEDGTMDRVFEEKTASGGQVTPGAHSITIDVTNSLRELKIETGSRIILMATLDPTGQVVESTKGNNTGNNMVEYLNPGDPLNDRDNDGIPNVFDLVDNRPSQSVTSLPPPCGFGIVSLTVVMAVALTGLTRRRGSPAP